MEAILLSLAGDLKTLRYSLCVNHLFCWLWCQISKLEAIFPAESKLWGAEYRW